MDRRTRCAQGPYRRQEIGRPLAPAVVAASTFEFDSQADIDRYYDTGQGYLYSRYGNPTVRHAEQFLAALEGAESATLFSSGMSAISTTLLTLARAGDRVAAQRELYGGSVELLTSVLPGLGIEVVWLGREELNRLEPERIQGCSVLYLETPINPTLRLIDLDRSVAAAREAGVPVAVDSTFATPILQRPIDRGVDLVVHSTTKYLGGHNDLIGGALVGKEDLVERVARQRRVLGGSADPFSAFLLYRGMRTLALRMETHCKNAAILAAELARHSRVEQVYYPGLEDHPDRELAQRQMDGFGGMVSFTVAGGAEAAVAVHDRLGLFSRAGSLGSVQSLVSIPARMSHRDLDEEARRRIGLPMNLVRLSVGLESARDLIADLVQALD